MMMITSLNPILNIGIKRCDPLQIHHLRMVNLLTSLCVFGTVFFSALFWFAFGSAPAAIISNIFVLLYLFAFVLTKKGLLHIAKYWIFVIFLSQQCYFPLFFLSENFETELLLLVIPTTLVLVFDPSERLPRYGISLIAIFLLFLAKTFPATDPLLILTQANAQAAYLCVILILVMLSVALMDFYLVDLHSINDSSRKLINEDILTGTSNSKRIFKKMELLFLKAKRKKQPLSVIAININDFKDINAMQGRDTGDLVLKHLSDLLKENLPDMTPLARLNGDTFIVLLENTNPEKTAQWAHKLKNVIHRSVLLMDNCAVKCTASLGVSLLDKSVNAGYQLIDNAMDAIKETKDLGKNRVSFFSDQKNETQINLK